MEHRGRLALILKRAFSKDQLVLVLSHIEAGTRPNCGKTADFWVHTRGVAIEVMALHRTLPVCLSTVPDVWQAAFVRLCRSGKILSSPVETYYNNKPLTPLTEYTFLLRKAAPADILNAVCDALG